MSQPPSDFATQSKSSSSQKKAISHTLRAQGPQTGSVSRDMAESYTDILWRNAPTA